MLQHVTPVRTDVSGELNASSIRVTRIGELGTILAITSNRRMLCLRSVRWFLVTASIVPNSLILVTLRKDALSFSETSVLTRATLRNIQEDAILHSHCHENLRSYMFCCVSKDIVIKGQRTSWGYINRYRKCLLYRSDGDA
jgi:hypothetical protein